MAKINAKYPEFERLFDKIDTWSIGERIGWQTCQNILATSTCGGSYSTFTSFVSYVLKILTEDGPGLQSEWHKHKSFVNSRFLVSPCCSPWGIPSEQEITEMEEVKPLDDRAPRNWQGEVSDVFDLSPSDTWTQIKWRWSAVACAISFFKSLALEHRLQIRRVLLLEDHESVGHPECHAIGLIPFCVENPRLHVERHINIWMNVLPARMSMSSEHTSTWTYLGTDDVSRCLEPWFSEAAVLSDMPAECYSLVFDGDPLPELSSKVFEEVKHDATCQLAVENYLKHNYSQVPLEFWRKYDGYVSEGMPWALKILMEDESPFIRCNFDTSSAYDEDEMVYRYNSLGRDLFEEEFWTMRSITDDMQQAKRLNPEEPIELLSPSPSWHEIRFSQILPAVPNEQEQKVQRRKRKAKQPKSPLDF